MVGSTWDRMWRQREMLLATVPILLPAIVVLLPVVWLVSGAVPVSGGTALDLPGGFQLVQNRSVLVADNRAYAGDVVRYDVVDDYIFIEESASWVVVNWKDKQANREESKADFDAHLRRLGLEGRCRLCRP